MTEQTPARRERAPISVRRAGGLQFETLDDLARFATFVAENPDMRPKSLDTPGKVIIVLQAGLERGMSPTQALQSIAAINGKLTVYGDGATSLVHASGELDEWEEWYAIDGNRVDTLPAWTKREEIPNTLTAWCRTRRKSNGEEVTRSFSVAEAKLATVYEKGRTVALWDKAGPWKAYPTRMLRWRAREWAFRDGFSDVLGGLHFRETALDYDPEPEHEVREIRDALPAAGEASAVDAPEPVEVESDALERIADDKAFLADLEENGWTLEDVIESGEGRPLGIWRNEDDTRLGLRPPEDVGSPADLAEWLDSQRDNPFAQSVPPQRERDE